MARNPAEAIVDRAGAEVALGRLFALIEELSALLETETALIGEGRLRDGLATEARKGELGQAYMRELQEAKANVVALTRHAPDRLREFRAAQSAFERVLDRNQTVIATARAVSEGLMRGLAEEMERARRPAVYGGPAVARAGAGPAAPLVFSRRY